MQEGRILQGRPVANAAVRGSDIVGDQHAQQLFGIFVLEAAGQRHAVWLTALPILRLRPGRVGQALKATSGEVAEKRLNERAIVFASSCRERIARLQ
ncbi:hypothetical protein FQZ97_1185160 [compost metagenome]